MRVLELFSGIGGCAAALPDAELVAIDQSEHANTTYRHNFDHRVLALNIAGLTASAVAEIGADLWWMSPPCQPFTVRGSQRDLDDPRCAGLLRVIELIGEVRPRRVALENVPAFEGSRAHAALRRVLADGGYTVRERQLCPTELGVPNRRLRFYLVASRAPLPAWPTPTPRGQPLAAYLHRDPDPALYVDRETLERYLHAMTVLPAAGNDGPASCFTSAYGRSPVRSGSFLQDARGVRRFSPAEILGLLHFPVAYELPPHLSRQRAWSLVGNSVSVAAVREVVALLR